MKILVLNSGSSSVKFQLFDMGDNRVIASGLVEKIGEASSYAKLKDVSADKIYEERAPLKDHHEGLEAMRRLFARSNILHDFSELDGIGHRIVHGGESFSDSALVTPDVIAKIEQNSVLAPLHNPRFVSLMVSTASLNSPFWMQAVNSGMWTPTGQPFTQG